MRAHIWIPLLALGALVVLLYAGMQDMDRALPSPMIGKAAPSLPVPENSEAAAVLNAAKGQPRLVNFWASWCQPCLAEHPELMALAERGVTIIGVNYKDEASAAARWLDRHGNPFAVVLRDPEGAFAIDWGVYGVPETYLIGPDDTVLHKKVGPVDDAYLRDELQPRLSALKGPAS
ncbi:DsbE family thiol:disulfide interchange protein [Algiphilus sp.]|uniref:DsbE family thiol:disulfide interchange protein n=1 Tax=Algiphilus sp. TaxID=1872431 RepID=UPI0032EAFC24